MTDNRTTELLRKLLDERGVKYSDFTSATKKGKAIFKTRWKHECGYAELSEWESTGSNNLFIQNVDPEQVIAATLGNARAERGTLTAEQVREAIMSVDRWEKPMGNTGMTNTHLIIRDDGWQAIADELNAELGGGNCARCAEDMGRYADSLCDPLKERTAELLRCLENDWHIHASWDGLRKFWCIELTEEGVWMRDAACGTLTAEQVREAIFHGSVYASYDGAQYYANGINMQAIADELNARAERTCHNTHENRWFKCSACGYGFTDLYAEDEGDIDEQPRYCPNCGRRVDA